MPDNRTTTRSPILILKQINPQADNKFRNNPSYVEFKQRTSPLLLLPPSLYKAIPNLIQVIFLPISRNLTCFCKLFSSHQCLCCCEFPIYNKLAEERGELTKENLEEAQVGRFGQFCYKYDFSAFEGHRQSALSRDICSL